MSSGWVDGVGIDSKSTEVGNGLGWRWSSGGGTVVARLWLELRCSGVNKRGGVVWVWFVGREVERERVSGRESEEK